MWNCYAQGILKETRENTKTDVKLDSSKLAIKDFAATTDSAGRIPTYMSPDKYLIVSAKVSSPKQSSQYYVNASVNPASNLWFLDCPQLINTAVTLETLVYIKD